MRVSPRRRSRELAMQGIYQWIYTGASAGTVLKNLSELEHYETADADFLRSQLKGTIGEAEGLRAHLEPLADRKWEEVSPVERAILLIGAWELVHNPEIPYKVTINEAIELGKRFSTQNSGAFINGILDKIKDRALSRAERGPAAARGDDEKVPPEPDARALEE